MTDNHKQTFIMRGMQCAACNAWLLIVVGIANANQGYVCLNRYDKCQPGVCLFIVGMTNADQGCYLCGRNNRVGDKDR